MMANPWAADLSLWDEAPGSNPLHPPTTAARRSMEKRYGR